MKFKYQNELDFCLQHGSKMPQLNVPNDKESFRFVFAEEKQKNHIPPHKQHPNRLKQQIECGNIDISGFALSNLETLGQATAFYHYLQNVCKNASKVIGDSLSFGVLKNEDGMITPTDSHGHFDLYESDCCDLNATFKIIQPL